MPHARPLACTTKMIKLIHNVGEDTGINKRGKIKLLLSEYQKGPAHSAGKISENNFQLASYQLVIREDKCTHQPTHPVD